MFIGYGDLNTPGACGISDDSYKGKNVHQNRTGRESQDKLFVSIKCVANSTHRHKAEEFSRVMVLLTIRFSPKLI